MTHLDNDGSQPLAMASVKGTIKWFNTTKGYGFITLENGSDAFCHASALAALGQTDVLPGATVVCDLQESPRGLQVVAVHSMDASTAEPQAPRPPRSGGRFGGGDRYGSGGGDRYGSGGDRFASERYHGDDRFSSHRVRDQAPSASTGPSGPMMEGRVKFFNDQKGFGFVMPENGGADVYIHASALRRSGLSALAAEQRIRFSTRQGMKGVEVDKIEAL